MLGVFFRNAQDFVVRFRAARASGDMDDAMRLAHDLKSMAATIGAQAVQRAAAALEQACRERGDDAALQALLAAAADDLAIVLNGLQVLQEIATLRG
jgi:HPt (histidine-containing phosphotransfer) domain-containing protein